MIRNVYVILAGLIAVAVICTAGVILHSIGGYHIELTPIIATVGAAGGIALICHEFGYSAGRNKALNDRFYPRVCKNIPVNPCYDFRESHRKGRP
ncbi:hypothetical protein [Pseudomonas aeruginosa]|uniref:hypothetical protein n=1 Tax=Pseudomonas aeruginosa TaxID=287 RepID=UPI0019697C06|nr:hypothetical protein [Pseudomonas aeruginosa]WMU49055.1 hypothetical protein P4B24_04405 [Pseudomonas aeruginosa]